MANVKISQLTEKTNPDGGEELLFAEGGNNGKISLNKVKEFSQPTIDSEMSDESENAVQNKVVKAYVDSKSFDEEGYYPKLHSGSTDQIYTEENTVSVGEWNFRTTAGDVSVPSSGEGTLNYIRGNMVRSSGTDTLADFRIATSEGLSITNFKKYAYLAYSDEPQGTYTFTCTGGTWNQNPEDWGVYYAFDDGISDGTITVEATAIEDRADLLVAKPKTFIATGVNQAGAPIVQYLNNCAIVDGYIVSSEGSTVTCVWAAGGVTNGYMAYDSNYGIDTIGIVNKSFFDQPREGDMVDQTGANIGNGETWMPFDNDCWFVVASHSTTFNDNASSIHPRWSNQQQYNADYYSSNVVSLPYASEDRNTLAYWDAGLSKIGDVYDELDCASKMYIQRIGREQKDYGRLQELQDAGIRFEYDNDYIYYVLDNEIRVKTQDFNNHYIANDYGTEMLWDGADDGEGLGGRMIAVKAEVSTSYGTNLVDKLRTSVATKDQLPQIMFQGEYNDIGEQKNSDGVVRFIYTCDKPDNFEVYDNFFDSSVIGQSRSSYVAGAMEPEWYPFEVSVTSSDDNVISVSNPYVSGNGVICEVSFNGVGTADISVTIGGVTKTGTWEISGGV